MQIHNNDGESNSLQVSDMGVVPTDKSFEPGFAFLLKNDAEIEASVTGILATDNVEVTTIIFVGWNVEIFRKITSTTCTDLKWGR